MCLRERTEMQQAHAAEERRGRVMKKIVGLMVLVLAVSALTLSSCKKKEEAPAPPPPAEGQ